MDTYIMDEDCPMFEEQFTGSFDDRRIKLERITSFSIFNEAIQADPLVRILS